MSYEPKYTSAAYVQAITQFTSSGSTNPTTTEILRWIEEVEADADVRCLTSKEVIDQIIDVPSKISYPAKNTLAWLNAISGRRYVAVTCRIIIPPFTPIVEIDSLSRRTTSLTEVAVWEELTEGPGTTASWILLKKRTKTDQYLGFGIYFYQNTPHTGIGRIKMTYTYGWNLDTDIVGEWCTLQVALKILSVEQWVHTPYGIRDKEFAYGKLGIDLEKRIIRITTRIEEIEKRYFPGKPLAIGFF